MKTEFIELLKNKKDDIITTITLVAGDSLMPDFYGTYDIYMDERDGEIYVFQITNPLLKPANKSLRFLHSINSHATKEGDFKNYLTDSGIPFVDADEKALIRKFRSQYNLWIQENVHKVNHEIIFANETYDKIVGLYMELVGNSNCARQ